MKLINFSVCRNVQALRLRTITTATNNFKRSAGILHTFTKSAGRHVRFNEGGNNLVPLVASLQGYHNWMIN
jgi:hypothetical protein